MKNVKTNQVFENQIPEFIANDAPKFIDFLDAYYRFLDQSYDLDINALKSIDIVPDNLLQFLKSELAPRFPTSQINDRKLLSLINYIFKRKGTVSAIELLFQIFYNEVITVYTPNTQILRPSDGIWQQQSFITLEKTFLSAEYSSLSDLQPVGKRLKIENAGGIYFIEIEGIEELDDVFCRFFFRSFRSASFTPYQAVDIVSPTDELWYRGELQKSPVALTVALPGADWKAGQLIFVSATPVPTIATVKRVDSNGGMLSVDIIQHGYNHPENQIVSLNPYPNKPGNANFDIVSTPVDYDPLGEVYTYEHTLTINDGTDGFAESVTGYSSIQDSRAYHLEDYEESFYSGQQVIFVETTSVAQTTETTLTPEVTIDDYLAANTTLLYEFDWVARTRGSWFDGRGQPSNPNVRLQDSFFYQLFSYVITTTKQIDEFRPVANLIHPAGLKFFGELEKVAYFEYEEISGYRVLSQETVYLREIITPGEEATKVTGKVLNVDSLSPIDAIARIDAIKVLSDVINEPTDLITSFNGGGDLDDSVTETDQASLSLTKPVSDAVTSSDSITSSTITKGLQDSLTSSETISSIGINKEQSDTTTITDTGATTEYIQYTTEDYFGEDYLYDDYTLTIG